MRARSAVLILAFTVGARASAYPLLSMRPAPDVIGGPTDPNVAAAFYNPAALGFVRGLHTLLDGGARINLGSISRDAVNGRDGGSTNINFANLDSFAGVAWDLNTNAFALALALYTPFTEISNFPAASPVRYQERSQTFISFEQTLAAAYRLESHVSIGGGFVVNESWLDLRYARDAAPAGGSAVVSMANPLCGGACGFENPAAEQDVRLRGFGYTFGFSAGILVRPVERLWIGASYTNRALGGSVSLTDERRAHVTLAPDGSPSARVVSGGDRVLQLLPETAQAGVRVDVNPQLSVEASFRFVHYGARTALDVSLQGGNLSQAGLAPEFLIDRGLQNTYLVELSTRHQVGDSLRLSPSLTFESAAVAPDAVSAAALEGNKLDATLTAEWRVWHGVGHHALFLGGHVGGTGYILGRVSSRFSAAAEVKCVDSAYDLSKCQALNYGDAFPSASGNYTLFVLHVGAAVAFTY